MKEKQDTTYLFEAAQQVSLGAERKAVVRQAVVNHVQKHPVRKTLYGRHIEQKHIESRLYTFIHILRKKHMVASIALILTLLVGGGVSYAAEGALPGDTLYPVKVHINEEVRAAAAVGAEADARWDVRRVERRLQEVAVLSASGELSATQQSRVETQLQKHTQDIQQRINRLEEQGKKDTVADIRTQVTANIDAYEHIFDELEANEELDIAAVRPLLTHLQVSVEYMKTRAGSTSDVSSDVKSEGRVSGQMRSAESVIGGAEAFIERATLGAEARASAEAALQQSKDRFSEGKQYIEAGNDDAAMNAFFSAKQLAQEARVVAATTVYIQSHLDAMPVLDANLDIYAENEIKDERRNAPEARSAHPEMSDRSDDQTHESDDKTQDTHDIDVQVDLDADVQGQGNGLDAQVHSAAGASVAL